MFVSAVSSAAQQSPTTQAQRRHQRRVTRNESRYHSGTLLLTSMVSHLHHVSSLSLSAVLTCCSFSKQNRNLFVGNLEIQTGFESLSRILDTKLKSIENKSSVGVVQHELICCYALVWWYVTYCYKRSLSCIHTQSAQKGSFLLTAVCMEYIQAIRLIYIVRMLILFDTLWLLFFPRLPECCSSIYLCHLQCVVFFCAQKSDKKPCRLRSPCTGHRNTTCPCLPSARQ